MSTEHNTLVIEVKPGKGDHAIDDADLHKIEHLVHDSFDDDHPFFGEIGGYRAGVALIIDSDRAIGRWRGHDGPVDTTWVLSGGNLGTIAPD